MGIVRSRNFLESWSLALTEHDNRLPEILVVSASRLNKSGVSEYELGWFRSEVSPEFE